jgi:hypothetical protein
MNRPRDIFDDLAALRIDQNDPRLVPKTSNQRPKAKRQRQFIIVPRIWMLQLRSAKKVTTYRLALLLLYEHWRNGGQPVRVTNALAAEFGVLRRSKHSALEELKQLNLIEVERGPRTAPLVTPLLSSA